MTEPVKRKSRRLLCAALALCTLFSCLTALTCFADDGQERYELPIISIHSAKGAESSTSYTDVTIRIENAEKAFCLEECDAAWKIHGRSSARNSKKSYNVRFPERTDLLGMGAAKKWVLVGNPYDKSLLRNKLMYDLSGAVGMLYPMESRFVELYVNDRYRGVYQLCEAPEIDRERVAIHPAREEFLLEILLAGRKSDDPVITTPEYHLQFTLNDLDYLPKDQRAWLKDFFEEAEQALQSGDREAIARYFDLDSMANGYILYEFSKNADLAIGSTRFIIRDGKIFSGAAWDFDLACGNDAYHCDPLHLVNGTRPALTDGWYAVQLWYRELVRQEWFQELFAERYLALQPVLVNLYADNELGKNRIDLLVEAMPEAIAHNYRLWRVSGNDYSLARAGDKTYEQNVDFLRKWLKDRNEWIVSQLEAGKRPSLKN